MQNRVSVIIPVYNVAQYLEECLVSVCNQTYGNLEIIIVDDGSTDESSSICDVWQEKDSRIRVLHKENGGLSSARNAGLDLATGKYIYFVDSDDTIKDTLIEIVVGWMEKGCDLVAFRYKALTDDENAVEFFQGRYEKYEIYTGQERARFISSVLLRYKIGWEAWSRIFSREIIEQYHLRFADNRRIFAEDLYFSLCYCVHCNCIVRIEEVLYNYRQREDSIMRQDSSKLNIGRMNELSKEVLWHYMEYEECNELMRIFPVVHYLIIDNVLTRAIKEKIDWKSFRKVVIEDIDDMNFFESQVRRMNECCNYLYGLVCGSETHMAVRERLSILKYICDGNYFMFRLRNRRIYKIEQERK